MSVLVKYGLSIAKILVRINLAKSIGKERLNIGYILANPNRYLTDTCIGIYWLSMVYTH